jgi:hypothetical protein
MELIASPVWFARVLDTCRDTELDALLGDGGGGGGGSGGGGGGSGGRPALPPLKKPRIVTSKTTDAATERAIVSVSFSSASSSSSSSSSAPALVNAWFAEFHREGCAGNVGLVPEPMQSLYPARMHPPDCLEKGLHAILVHFAEWMSKRQ